MFPFPCLSKQFLEIQLITSNYLDLAMIMQMHSVPLLLLSLLLLNIETPTLVCISLKLVNMPRKVDVLLWG